MNMLESWTKRIEDADGLDGVAGLARSTAHGALVDQPVVDSFLEGEWLGHRLHPLAAQVPMGAWLMAVVLDLADSEKNAAAVDTLVRVGCAAALPTAVAGAHDLATTSGSQTRVALVHAASMDAALGLFTVSWLKRRRGDRRAARRFALAGIATAGASAYLGGHLVYRMGVGVRR